MSLMLNGHKLIGMGCGNKIAVAQDTHWGDYDGWDSLYRGAFVKDGYGFLDGEIKGPSVVASENREPYRTTNCSGYNVVTGQLTGNGNYCLTQDTTLNLSDFVEDTEFSGILDGCGYTLTINCYKDSFNANSSHAWGALIGTLTGTVKNIKIVTNFYWKCTRSNGYAQYVGGVCGRINGGTLDNVYVQIGYYSGQSYNMDYSGRPTSNALKMVGGVCGEISGTPSITNVTIQIDNMGWRNTDGGSWTGRPDVKLGIGGFTGHIASGAVVLFKNCSNRGSGNLDSWAKNGGDGGGTKIHKGGFIAYSEGLVTFTNVKNGWEGNFTHGGGQTGEYQCGMIGAYDTGSGKVLTITNCYYSLTSHVGVDGWLEYQDTKTAIIEDSSVVNFVASEAYDATMENYVGFLGDKLWIGDKSSISPKTLTCPQDIKGTFIDAIVYKKLDGSSGYDDVVSKVTLANMYKHTIVTMDPSKLMNISGTMRQVISGFRYGYYAYLSNEKGSTQSSYIAYYNNGQTCEYTFTYAFGVFNGRWGIYNRLFRVTSSQVSGAPSGTILFLTFSCTENYYNAWMEQMNWTGIAEKCKNGDVPWPVGEKKRIRSALGNNYFYATLVDKQEGRYKFTDDDTYNHAVFEISFLPWGMKMNNATGVTDKIFDNTDLAQALNNGEGPSILLNVLPDELKSVIKSVKMRVVSADGSIKRDFESKFIVPSKYELFPSTLENNYQAYYFDETISYKTNTRLGQYDYYKTNTDASYKIKTTVGGTASDYWNRTIQQSLSESNTVLGTYVDSEGAAQYKNLNVYTYVLVYIAL